jgi:hypothetical protein
VDLGKKSAGPRLIKIPLKCVISLCSKKKWPRYFQKTEKILEVIIFKNKYFLNKKSYHLAVLREEARDSLLPVNQI